MFKSHTTRGFLICLGVTIVVIVSYLMLPQYFDVLEMKAVDFRFMWRGDRDGGKNVSVIAVDEKSIEKLGRWPWPRSTHAKLVRQLRKAGANVVAFDVLFTEADLDRPQGDADLARAAAETGIVVSASFYKDGIQQIFGRGLKEPYKSLAENSVIGFVNLEPDGDGVTRRAPLVAVEETKDGQFLQSPSLAVAAYTIGQDKEFDEVFASLPTNIDLNTPLLSQNKLFVNYAFKHSGEYGSAFPIYSYLDVLEGKVDLKAAFDNQIVFVGSVVTALFDMKAIPLVSNFPGVLVHANVVDNLINGNFIREAPTELTLIYVLFLGLALGFLLPRLAPWLKLVVFVVLVGGAVVISYTAFAWANYMVPMVPPLLTGFGCYFGTLFYRLLIEEREKRKIKGSFKQYLSPKIIDIITRDPSKLKLGGEEREVTIFFLDIAGFTTMSEALKPTQLVEVMNQCLSCFSSIVLKHEGLINKYIGDCIMAFWNAPVDQPDHAGKACLAALDCINALPALNKEFAAKGLPDIDCRIGVNTGTVVVGNMGSHERFDYTVMGDPVNLASRLEGANKEYHSHIMISDVTFEKARGFIEARDLDLIQVKGKKEPRRVFEVLCKKDEMTEASQKGREKYHEALKLYRGQKFSDAIALFEEVLQLLPSDHLTRKYMERARVYAINPPPPAWNGVFEMKTK